MSEAEPNPIDELNRLLDELESAAPSRGQSEQGNPVIFRSVADEDVVDDSLTFPEFELDEDSAEQDREIHEDFESDEVSDFQVGASGPVAAVDCGIVRLGETENGLVIALRASLSIDRDNGSEVRVFRTGPMYLHNQHKIQTLHQMGKQLGKPDLFVELEETEEEDVPQEDLRPTRVKRGVADDAHQYGDRFRNWFERLVQRIAVSSIEGGIVLLDGALTLRTRDTPEEYLEYLGELANGRGNTIVAISKQSMLQVGGKSIRFWLNDATERPCYRWLTPLMNREESERVLGNVYAARFSSIGPTFRTDLKAAEGQSDDEAMGKLYSSTLMRGGYPDILVRAHTHSYFTSPDVLQLQAQAAAKYTLVPQGEINLTGIFAPFGGRFK